MLDSRFIYWCYANPVISPHPSALSEEVERELLARTISYLHYKQCDLMFKKLFGSTPSPEPAAWETLSSPEQLDTLQAQSVEQPVLIFKHSTRCSVSSMALNRLQRATATLQEAGFRLVLLDLIRHRALSDQVAERLGVIHQSPQVIVLRDKKPVYDASHTDIQPDTLMRH